MPFVSYAQNFEDVMLWRALQSVQNGFYIDVGACDPDVDSVTRSFYEIGWSGINIEPVTQWYERLQQKRPLDLNLQVAAGERNEQIQFYEIPNTGLSTSDRATALRHERERGVAAIAHTVPVYTVTEICEQHCKDRTIHFMKIDVEGAEESVLKGIDFSRIRPWVILIESTIPNRPTEDFSRCSELLDAAGYHFVYFDGLNRFYLSPEHPELGDHFKVPPNVFDDFTLSGTGTSSFVYLQNERISALERQLLALDRELLALKECKQEYELILRQIVDDTGMTGAGHLFLAGPAAGENRIVEQQLAQIRARVRGVCDERDQLRQEFERAVVDGRYWQLKTETLMSSLSWKLTGPVRAVANALAKGGELGKRGFVEATHYPLRLALANPIFAAKVTDYLLKRFPGIHRFLRDRAVAIGSMQDTQISLYGKRHRQGSETQTPPGVLLSPERYETNLIPTEVLIDRLYHKVQKDRASA